MNILLHGSFLPASLALQMGKLKVTELTDKNVGANLMHYAAHHGNLKFLRYANTKA